MDGGIPPSGFTALVYFYDSLQNMIDHPLRRETLMDVDDVLIEITLLEEVNMKKEELPKPPQQGW